MAKEKSYIPAAKELSEMEFSVMSILWRSGKEYMISTEIQDVLLGKKNWPLSEVMTYLKRLEVKKYLKCDRKMRKNQYYCMISEEDFIAKVVGDFLQIHNLSAYDITKIAIEKNLFSHDDCVKCNEVLSQYFEQT